MDPERWSKIRGVFERALELPGAERSGFVLQECGDDADLRRSVEELIATDTAASVGSEILDRTPATDLLPRQVSTLEAGTRVANYVIDRVIGSGGMGTVYEARQNSPARTVAIKVMNRGLRSESARRRFQFEAETLGRLEHPGIARIYEAGTFSAPGGDDDLPFFAMEAVDGGGCDLAAWIERDRPTRSQRLELLRQVCDAVHYGHLQGVVHRDLKPANVLVDAAARPKVIDFGIARSLESNDRDEFTRAGQVIGTLNYASPEQFGSGRPVDARADVYSLGVLAYWLLSDGELPHHLDDIPLAAAARALAEETAPRLGARDRELRGDVETIVAKALEKDPARRYQSASDLGRDLANFIQNRPILARPPSAVYQLRKFARRHRAAFAGAVVALLALVTGLAVVTWQNTRIRAEQQRTERVSAFFRGIVAEADAFERGKDFTMREALDAAAARIDEQFADDSKLEAEIRYVVGDTYRKLAVYDSAELHLERAWQLQREDLGAEAAATIATQESLALLRWSQDRSVDALALQELCVAANLRRYGERDPQTLSAMQNHGLFLKAVGRIAEAEAEYRRTFELRREVLGADHSATLITSYNLGKLLLDAGRDREAREILSDVLTRRERVLGIDHCDTLITIDVLGLLDRSAGRFDAAERAHRRALEGFRAQLGDTHEHTLAATSHLVWALLSDGRGADAAPLADAALAACERVLGVDHSHTLRIRRMAAAAARATGQTERAGQLARSTYESAVRRHGLAHRTAQRAAHDLAFSLHEDAEFDAALAILRAADLARRDASPSGDPDRIDGASWMIQGLCLIGRGDHATAQQRLLESLELHRGIRGPHSEETLGSLNCLVRLYESWNRPEDLARWTAERDAVAAARADAGY